MRVELWIPGQPIGHFSVEEAAAIQGEYTGPMVAVIDEHGGAAIIQPMNPDTGENWASEEEAMAFGYRYLNPPQQQEQPNPEALEDPRTQNPRQRRTGNKDIIDTTVSPEPAPTPLSEG